MNNMNNTHFAGARKYTHFLYTKNVFSKGTEFEVSITDGMNGKNISQPQTVYTLDAAKAIISEWIDKSIIPNTTPWQPIYFYADRIVINFGSWVAWGLIKIIYSAN